MSEYLADGATTVDASYPLFLDEPTDVDLLSFDAVASTVVDALLDPRLDPIALGLSGSWGSGKTSVLRPIAQQLRVEGQDLPSRIVIETDPWKYDPQLGIKESLIGEILAALEAALPTEGAGAKSEAILQRLLKRIDWTKAIKLAAKSAITVTLPSLDGVLELVKPKQEEGKEKPEPITDMVQFRCEFRDLLKSDDLKPIRNVVVLVDDLDRCLPDTVVETLETIRLFLLLGLSASGVSGTVDSSGAIKKVLGGLKGVAIGITELRNAEGSGHGRTRALNLAARHARLAVNAGRTWCEIVLDTYSDPTAPWRRRAATESAAPA